MPQYNTGVSLRNFLETDEKPIELDEFWDSLTEEEKEYFRFVELSH